MFKTILLFLLTTIFLTMALPQSNKKAFINGKIYTVNEKQPYAESVIIEKNKIVFVGSDEQAEKLIDKSTQIIDLD
jgi:predicted amidohydrolase YtcJ